MVYIKSRDPPSKALAVHERMISNMVLVFLMSKPTSISWYCWHCYDDHFSDDKITKLHEFVMSKFRYVNTTSFKLCENLFKANFGEAPMLLVSS